MKQYRITWTLKGHFNIFTVNTISEGCESLGKLLILFSVMYGYVNVCVSLCGRVFMHMCACACGGQRSMLEVFFCVPSLLCLHWLVSKSQGFSCLHTTALHTTGATVCFAVLIFLCRYQRSELKSSHLCGEHFTE